MIADTEAIRVLGAAHREHAAQLGRAAAALSVVPATTSFGPVGERFLAALADAVARERGAIAALSDAVASAGATAAASAAAYHAADIRVRDLLGS